MLAKRGNLAAISAIDDADLGVIVDLAHEPDAPRAEDAAIPVEHQRRSEVDVGLHTFAVEDAAGEVHAALGGTERVREILQGALASFVADRAIERVIDEQKLENARARLHHLSFTRLHNHALGAHGRARGLQLSHFLDLDDADAT